MTSGACVSAQHWQRWMSEVYVDAAPVFMVTNVAIMGHFDDRFTHKPYLSTSAYLARTSDYGRSDAWDGMFYAFLLRNERLLASGTRRVYARNLAAFKRTIHPERRRALLAAARLVRIAVSGARK